MLKKWFSTRKGKDFYRYSKQQLGVGLHFTGYVKEAFTHKNAREENQSEQERLEFIGDALIGWVVARTVFREYPEFQEGDLSQMRSHLVNRKYLNTQSKQFDLFQWCDHAFDEQAIPENIHGNILEALVGAVYLEKGYTTARELVGRLIPVGHISTESLELVDPKSKVYIWAQRNDREIVFVETEVLDEDRRITGFVSELTVPGKGKFIGKASSKKEAQMKASSEACKVLI